MFETKHFFRLSDSYSVENSSDVYSSDIPLKKSLSVSWVRDGTVYKKTVENDRDAGPFNLLQLQSALADLIQELNWHPSQPSSIHQITYATVIPSSDDQYQVKSKAIFTKGVVMLQTLQDSSIAQKTGFMGQKIFKELSEYIIKKDFFSLEESYGSPETSTTKEGKVVGVFWSLDGATEEYKMVFDWDQKAPYHLRRLETVLQEALASAEWEEEVVSSMILYSGFALTLMFLSISGFLIFYYAHKSCLSAAKLKEAKEPILTFKEETI